MPADKLVMGPVAGGIPTGNRDVGVGVDVVRAASPVCTMIDRLSGDQLGSTLAISYPPSAGITSSSLSPSGEMTRVDVFESGSPNGWPV